VIKISVDMLTLKRNQLSGDVLLHEPPIVIWDNDKEIKRLFRYDISEESEIVYRPESPLPSGSTTYIVIYE